VMIRLFYILSVICGCCSFVLGQKVRLEISNLQPKVGEYITVQMTSSIGSNFELKFPDAFQSGMNTMSGMRQEFINGRSNTVYYRTLSGFFKAPGVFNMGPVYVLAKNKKYASKRFKVSVGDIDEGIESQKRNVKPSNIKPPVFAETYCSAEKIYRGQSVFVKSRIYSKKEFSSIRNYNPYSIDQKVESIKYRPKKELDWEPKKLDGQEYLELLFEEKIIFPQEIGAMNISSFEMVLSGYGNYVVRSEPNTVEVLELPKRNQPSGFSGLVGSFEVSSSISDTLAKSNAILSLTMNINGVGNLQHATAPEIILPDGLELYSDPIKTKKFTLCEAGYKGSVIFTYPIRVLTEQSIVIPSNKVSFFDPVTDSYVTLESNEIGINSNLVISTSNKDGSESTANVSNRNTGLNKEELSKQKEPWNNLTEYILVFCLTALFLFGLIKRKRKKQTSLTKKEFLIPRKQDLKLGISEALDPKLEISTSLAKMEHCLFNYCSFKLSQDSLKLSRNEIYLLLKNHLSQENLKNIQVLFSSIDAFRFGNNIADMPFNALKRDFKDTLTALIS